MHKPALSVIPSLAERKPPPKMRQLIPASSHPKTKNTERTDPNAGDILMTTNGTWGNKPTSFTYQWQDCAEGACTNIGGATSRSYTVQPSAVGYAIRVVVTAHNSSGAASASSPQTSVVRGGGSGTPTVNYFVAQSAAGSGNGSSCANAGAVSTLSGSTHWTAGNVIGLCGTITSPILAGGSGTASNPITVYWEPGATMSSPDWGGSAEAPGAAFNTDGNHYLTLNGGNNGTSFQATAEGSGLADQGIPSRAILANDCTGCTFENLTIANLYVHSMSRDTTVDQTLDNAFLINGGSNITIANNTIHDVGWAIVTYWNNGDGNDAIYGNNIYDTDHGWVTAAAFSGGSIGPFSFYDNHVHDEGDWDTPADTYHHDGIHCFSPDARGFTPHYNGLYIYDNRFDGNTGADMTGDIFIEGGSGIGSTPCGDSTSHLWIFDNVASVSSGVNAGVVGIYSTTPHVVNNTIISSDTSTGVGYLSAGGTAIASNTTFENNIVTTVNQLITTAPSFMASGQPDYNVYANGSNNAFVCGKNYIDFSQFSTWKSCIRADAHSTTASSASLNTDGSPRAGSPALGAGTNLHSSCTGSLVPLCSNIAGTARPRRGAWNAGAY